MPTGYTAELMEKGMEFKPFVLGCARAFGALISLRDAPQNTPFPEKIEPSNYYAEALIKATEKLSQLQAMTDEERITFGEREKVAVLKERTRWETKETEENLRLDVMQKTVEAWSPPTPEHIGLKRFMLDQISISRHDTDYIQRDIMRLQKLSAQKFYEAEVDKAERDIKYYTEETRKRLSVLLVEQVG